MLTNKNFIFIEEYDNVPDTFDLSFIINRFCPKIFLDRFVDYTKETVNTLSNHFYTNNHVLVAATNRIERLNQIKESFNLVECTPTIIKYSNNNSLSIHKYEFLNNNTHYLIVILLLENYYVAKQSLVYRMTEKK